MVGFKAAISNELTKIFKNNKFIIFTIITLLCCILNFLAKVFIQKSQLGFLTIFFKMDILFLMIYIILPFYIFAQAMEVFVSEYMNGSIMSSLLRPVSRINIFFSKFAAIFIFIAIQLTIGFVFTTTTNIFVFHDTSDIFKIFTQFILSIIPLIMLISYACAIAQVCKNNIFGMILSIFIFIFLNILALLYSNLGDYIFTSQLKFYNYFAFSVLNIQIILTSFVQQLAYICFFISISLNFFIKKEF